MTNQEGIDRDPSIELPFQGKTKDGDSMRMALIDERPLTRAGLVQLIQRNAPEFVVLPLPGFRELVNGHGAWSDDIGLIVLNMRAACIDEGFRDDMHRLKHAFPDTPLAMISDRNDASTVIQAFDCGVSGFLHMSLSPAVLIQGLRLIRVGGTFVPAEILVAAIEAWSSGAKADRASDTELAPCEGFTPRESEVLQLLVRGKSNKVIASELDMQESTVKVHLRHIMKKLRATNRTQAALLAYQMGVAAYSAPN